MNSFIYDICWDIIGPSCCNWYKR